MSVDNIKVAIKARPILKKEKDANLCWKISNNSIQVAESQSEPFYFDHIFDQDASNEEIFNTVIKPIVHSCIGGINGTIFAYGQTSSGKTYTMLGDEENPGVMILAMKEIFNFIKNSPDRLFLLRVSYIEIYNEKIYDLLNKDNKDLKIHESTNGEVNVNCCENIVTSELDILKHLQAGNKIRKCGETNMNERSSRSHAIFKLIVESRDKQINQENEAEAVQISSLNLVDLAGSERADQTGATGSRLKEGSHINKSLLSLGCVIKSLSESAESVSFINYRNSKLTRILQASLGGNALTAIICNIKLTTIEETNSTLNFALRAKTVKNKPHVNEVLSDAAMMKMLEKKITKLQSELEMERKQNSKLKILELEKQIKLETHKIVNPQTLKIEKYHNRRRTWCPSSSENNSVCNRETNAFKLSLKCEEKTSVIEIPNFISPLITLRNETQNDFEEDDLFKESPAIIDSSFLYTPNNDYLTPKTYKADISKSPDINEKYEVLERNFKELETFISLEKDLGVNLDYLNSLKSKLETCQSEISNKNNEIQKLHLLKLDTDLKYEGVKNEIYDKNILIANLEKNLLEKDKNINLEMREKINIECEFEQFKNKSKIREQELLDLIKEKDDILKKLELQNRNTTNSLQDNYKLNNNSCKWCSNILKDDHHKSFVKFNNNGSTDFVKIIESNNKSLSMQCTFLLSKYSEIEEAFEAQKNGNNLLKNKYQLVINENENLKSVLRNNNELFKSMEEECSAVKNLISTLAENVIKLEEEQNNIFKDNVYKDVQKLRMENNAALQKINCLQDVLVKKDREHLKFKNMLHKIVLNFSSLRNQLNEINTTIKNESSSFQEKFYILSRVTNHLIKQENIKSSNTSKTESIQLDLLRAENENLSEKIMETLSDLDVLTEDNKKIKLENDSLKKKIDNLKMNLNVTTKEHQNLKVTYDSLNSKFELLNTENKNILNELEKGKNTIILLNEQYETLSNNHHDVKLCLNDSKLKLDLQSKEIQNLTTLNKNMSKELEELKITNQMLNTKIMDNSKKYDSLQELKQYLEVEKKNILLELQKINSDNKILNQQIDNSHKKIENLEYENNKILKEYNDLDVEKKQLMLKVEHSTQNRSELESIKQKFACELEQVKQCKQQLAQKLEESEKEISNLFNLNKTIKDIAKVESEKLNLACENLKKEIQHTQAENKNRLQIALEEKKHCLETLQSKFEEERNKFYGELEYLKNELDQYKKECEPNKTKLSNHSKPQDNRKIFEALKSEINQLKIKNESLKAEIELKEKKCPENMRRLRRQSCHDESRSFFFDATKDVSTMTDPTTESCSCTILAEKIEDLKKNLLIKDSHITSLKLQMNNNTMPEEILELKEELLRQEIEKEELNQKIQKMKEELQKQSQKYEDYLSQIKYEEKEEKKKLNQNILELKEELKINSKKYAEKLEQILNETQAQKEKEMQDKEMLRQEIKKQIHNNKETVREILINKQLEQEKLLKEFQLLKSEKITKNNKSDSLKPDIILIENCTQTNEILKENYTPTAEENILRSKIEKLIEINKDLKAVCRYRYAKINALENKIDEFKKK